MLTLISALGLVFVACGGESTTTAASLSTEAAVETTVGGEPSYRIQVAVSHEEQQLGAGRNEPAVEFAVTYDLAVDLTTGESRAFPNALGSVDWIVRCLLDGVDIAAGDITTVALEFPEAHEEIAADVIEEFPDEPWLAAPAMSVHDVDGDLWIIHRFASAVRSGQPVACDGSPEPTEAFVPAVGAAWMSARALNVGGAPLSRADVRNLEIGSFPTTYFTEAIGGGLDESGWVIAIVRPEDLGAGPVDISFRDTREDADVEYDFAITGQIEVLP